MRTPSRFPSLLGSLLGFALCTAALAALTACGGEADTDAREMVGRQASAVQGGAIDTNVGDNFAVGVASRQGALCSGTLIAPNLVLTARHCVVPPGASEAVSCANKFAPSVAPSMLFVTTQSSVSTRKFYPVMAISTPTDANFCGNDIALLTLANLIPESEAKPAIPVVQFQMTNEAKIGTKVTAIGYGITSPTANDAGERRIRENIDILCVPGSRSIDCTGDFTRLSDNKAEFVTAGWVCSGDSGGGAFEQRSFSAGAPYVLGALSRGPQSSDTCLAAVYSRTDAHAQLIIDTGLSAAKQGGYAAPAWTAPLEPGAGVNPTPDGTVCVGDTCTDTSATDPGAGPAHSRTAAAGCAATPGSRSGLSSWRASSLVAFAGALVVLARRRRRHGALIALRVAAR